MRGRLPISLDDVLAAREAIGARVHRTPMLTSATLSAVTGADVRLKAELFQRTGSFKPRGVLNKVASLTADERRRGVIATSAGNLAQAVAYAASGERIDALVVMWATVSATKIAATRAYGAAVDVEAATPAEALERTRELAERSGRVFIRPWDDPLVMAGHGTLGLEIVEDAPQASAVVCPVGGAGLVSGLAIALKARRPEVRVVGVEPELAPALHAALDAGRPVSVEPRSIADGLNAPQAGEGCLPICSALLDELVLISEAEIGAGFRFLYERAKLACEPAGAAATAALLAGKVELAPGETVVSVVSGGNVAPAAAAALLADPAPR